LQNIERSVKNDIVETLTKNKKLSYSKIYDELTSTKNDRTFRKYLAELVKEGIVKRKKSIEDDRCIVYSVRGFELEDVNAALKKLDKELTTKHTDLKNRIKTYIKYKKQKINPDKLKQYELRLANEQGNILNSVFTMSHTVLFLKLSTNVPLYKKAHKLYKKHLAKLVENLTLLRIIDYESFKNSMAVAVLKTDIKIPGLVT